MAKVEVTTEARHGIPAGAKLTPMMQQYIAAKERYPDALLFFRMGDFYEMFYEDAEIGGRCLDLTITSRDKDSPSPAPMSGFPHHQLPAYLSKALAAGYKIAVCDQLEDPSLAKGIVKRGITRVVTPGVVLDDQSLEARAPNFLVSVMGALDAEDARYGVACFDVSTGVFRVTEAVGLAALRCELGRLQPREILLLEGVDLPHEIAIRLQHVAVSRVAESAVTPERCVALLGGLLGDDGKPAPDSVEAFGFGMPALMLKAAAAIAAYVIDTQQQFPENARILSSYRLHDTLILDETAQANLELFKTLMEGRKRGSLLGTLDRACTAMGGRKIRSWLAYPLIDPVVIGQRLDAVECLVQDSLLRESLRQSLQKIYDIERLNGRIAAGTASPRDLVQLRCSLESLPKIIQLLQEVKALSPLLGRMEALEDIAQRIAQTLVDEPPNNLRDGGVIRPGFNAQLDEYVMLTTSGHDYLAKLEAKEREATGIASLKIRYNKVFGYYIEISKANLDRAPSRYIRRQTLANAERFYTEELKDFEDKVLNAEANQTALEAELFTQLRSEVAASSGRIESTASGLAELDALSALAELAHRNHYCRPVVDDGDAIDIEEGRHPVVEESVGQEGFVPNSVHLDRESQSLIVLTGPNMAGKSTVMRQVALITLLAQMGSFVPAKSAHIGVVDRIFTRVGAADDLAAGRSTFMVEMYETSVILKEATARSLLILDEIGRGTSTFDGVSIAWAVAEYVHDVLKSRTLFATHYHELTDLAEVKPRVRNFTIAVRENGEDVVFLRQLVPGIANRSYGIQVAKLAGLPPQVTRRAGEVLMSLQGAEHDENGRSRLAQPESLPEHGNWQLSLFSPPPLPAAPSAVERELRSLDVDQLTPIQALNFLHALKARL